MTDTKNLLTTELKVIHDKEQQIIALDNKINLNNTLLRCIRTLSENEDMKQAIDKLLEILCGYYDGNRGYIFECSEDDTLLNNTYEWCAEGVSAEIDNLQNIPKEVAADWFVNFSKYGSFYISNLTENLDENSADYRILEAQGIQSLMAAPLLEGDVIKGFIGIDDPREQIDNFSLLTSVTYFIINDIQKRRMVMELETLSFIDVLTELFNRNKYLKDIVQLEKNRPDTLGVVYIDVNGLKVTNDRLGHDYGDYLLKKLADTLTNIFKGKIYRIGGDEFVVLCPDIAQEEFENSVQILRHTVAGGEDFAASIGTIWEEKTFNVKKLIKHADDLMYANKQQYYQGIQVEGYNHNYSLVKQLLDDLNEGRYKVFLQPKISLTTDDLCGAEALIRGSDKDGNLVFPDNFIPMFEAHGMIRHIDFYVLETVCRLIHDLKEQGKEIGNISVNFSRITLLEYDVVNSMIAICRKHDINPSVITIEVTESTAKLRIEELVALVYNIKEAGFGISLDDYGTEYSNMAMLTNIGFDEIKLDRSIINELTVNEKTRTIIQYTIRMLKELEMCQVVAEGIETLEELDILKEYGCDCGQGYHFSRPIPIGEFLDKYFQEGK